MFQIKNNFLNQYSLKVLIILTAFLHIFLFSKNLNPYVGIEFDQNQNDEYEISEFHSLGWGRYSELEVGDEIVQVDDHRVEQLPIIETNREIGSADRLTVRRDEQVFTINVAYTPDLFGQYILHIGLPLIYFIFSFILSFVLLNRPKIEFSSRVLTVMILLISLSYMSSSLAMKHEPIGMLILSTVFLLSPAVFYHFVYLFFKEKDKQWYTLRSVWFLYTVAMVGSTLTLYLIIQQQFTGRHLLLPFFIIIMMGIVIQLIRGLIRLRKDPLINTLQGFLIAITVAVAPFLFLFVLPKLIIGRTIIIPELANVFLFFIPAGFLYMTVTDQLYVLKFKINQFPYHLTLAALFSFVMTVVYMVLGNQTPQSREHLQFFFYTIVLTFIFLFIKKRLDSYLRYQLFVSRHDFQASVYRFGEMIKREKDRQGIIKAFKRELSDVLPVIKLEEHQLKPKFDQSMQKGIDPVFIPLLRDYQTEQLNLGQLLGRKGRYAIPIDSYQKELTVLFIATQTEYLTKDQLDWLTSLIQFTRLALENQTKIDELLEELEEVTHIDQTGWLSRLMFHWSENERQSLARDIHDTFLQDLIQLKRQLESIRYLSNPEQLKTQIIEKEEAIKDMIYEVRETCTNLYPTVLAEVGLMEAIDESLTKFRLQSNSHLLFETNVEQFDDLSKDIQLSLFRIIQEWLTNAKKHAQASQISINLRVEKEYVYLNYEDDGKGFVLDDEKEPHQGMGLMSIKTRINSLKGTLKYTEKEQGVKMSAVIPIQKGEGQYAHYFNR
ncbi:two-component system, NarL family, sensor histidine kinase ComP [Pelagirhabdus alkalitolerans]|uniref:histidine kinase n=1 Tax=Pelagirhabdus alkalitolerans TaxID=1612202 RepID=A0A1G6KDM2_9BACI|nr:histidine kinase [Pelagirhabdus alkalitolerans]SDC28406.1 two-component system, NarL family, sensor histidine kinase ComP [Pelagirhabdus alkalitolerans]